MSLTNRRAEAFAAALEGTHGTNDPVVAPLVGLGAALRAIPATAGPAPEFRAALRQRLVAVATVQGVGIPVQSPALRLRSVSATWKFQRRIAAVAGGAAAVTAIAGVSIGASRSLPGDAFYGIKRATEQVQLAATFGTEPRGKRHLEFARTRMAEVQALAAGDTSLALGPTTPGTAVALGALPGVASSNEIVATLHDMDVETRLGAQDLLSVAQTSRSTEPLQALNGFTQAQARDLRSVLVQLPASAQVRAQASLGLLHAVAQRTVTLATTGRTGSGSPSQAPGPTGSATPRPQHSTVPATAPPTTPAPDRGSGHSGSNSPSSKPGGGLPSAPPTIPPLPSVGPTLPPLPVPTAVPTLPSVTGLLGH
jgi:hypothetical protein